LRENSDWKLQQVEKAARTIYYGLDKSKGLSANREFRELVSDYMNDVDFRSIVQAIASGLKLEILNIETSGVFLKPQYGSIFSMKKDSVKKLIERGEDKYIGLILIALAAYFFPTDTSFEEVSFHETRPITTQKLDFYITEKCTLIKEKEKPKDPKTGDDLLELLLVSYLQLPNEASPDSQRRSTREYFIRKTMRYLADERLLIRKGRDEFWLTPKFRLHMDDMAQNELLAKFLSIGNSTGEE